METELSELEKMEQETFEEDDSIDIPPPDIVAYNELRSCADLFRMYERQYIKDTPLFPKGNCLDGLPPNSVPLKMLEFADPEPAR
jgi:hypothetical protein